MLSDAPRLKSGFKKDIVHKGKLFVDLNLPDKNGKCASRMFISGVLMSAAMPLDVTGNLP